jgi:hypothetical protein
VNPFRRGGRRRLRRGGRVMEASSAESKRATLSAPMLRLVFSRLPADQFRLLGVETLWHSTTSTGSPKRR